MVSILKSLWIAYKWMRENNDGAAFQAKAVGDDNILVIVQPSKSTRAIGRPALCKVCNRINQLLTDLDKVAEPLPMPQGMSNAFKGEWLCGCAEPQRALGTKKCLRCDLNIF